MKAVAGRTFATRAQAHEARSRETKLRHETILLANGNLDDGREHSRGMRENRKRYHPKREIGSDQQVQQAKMQK